ncbi:MAG: hypothetical protein FJX90_04920 [Bacteroidetes bacterium]|nr:hypothetical protein [Bacteroidota bacterium]
MDRFSLFFIFLFVGSFVTQAQTQTDIFTQTNYVSESTVNAAATLLLGKNFKNGSSAMLRIQSDNHQRPYRKWLKKSEET